MALIICKDCGNNVSESASSCPGCGAPVPKTIGPNQEECPFCETIVSLTTRVCPSCGAQKGYTQAQGNVYGKGETIAKGILLPLVLALVALIFNTTFGTVILFIMLIPIALSTRRLIKGEVWYRSTNVHTG